MSIITTWRVWRFGVFQVSIDRRVGRVSLVLLVLLVVVSLLSLSYGDYAMSFADVFRTLTGGGSTEQQMVLWELRFPRVVIALLVGAALSVSGAMLQGLMRNPLADPGIIGINQGAAVAAVTVLVWFDHLSVAWLPPVAFGGGAVTALLIYLLAWKGGSSPVRLVLVGIGFASFASALTTVMMVFSDTYRVGQAYLWLSGSVYGRGWDSVLTLSTWLVVLLPLAYALALPMNAMLSDDSSATAVGLSVEKTRFLVMFISVGLASACVSTAGVFSFLGLFAPHISRWLVGPMYQGLLPVSALVGALMVVSADLIGRTIIAPNEIPAGLVTAMIGAPYFFWQMKKHYDR